MFLFWFCPFSSWGLQLCFSFIFVQRRLKRFHVRSTGGRSGFGKEAAASRLWPAASGGLCWHLWALLGSVEPPAGFRWMKRDGGRETTLHVFRESSTDSWGVRVWVGGSWRRRRAAADAGCLLALKWKPRNVSVWHPTSPTRPTCESPSTGCFHSSIPDVRVRLSERYHDSDSKSSLPMTAGNDLMNWVNCQIDLVKQKVQY